MDVVNVHAYSVEAQAPGAHVFGLNFINNSRRNEIISYFWPGTGPMRSGVARCT